MEGNTLVAGNKPTKNQRSRSITAVEGGPAVASAAATTNPSTTKKGPQSSKQSTPSTTKPVTNPSLQQNPISTQLPVSVGSPWTGNKNVSLFAHLPQFDRSGASDSGGKASITSSLLKQCKESYIHPAIIRLGLAFASYSVMGGAERCRQMLLAFKQVFKDYQAPSDQAISRHLEAHLRPSINYLVQARPLAVSMGHAIRHLKLKISTLPPDTTESEARGFMIAVIDNYIRNRIDLADQLICQHGLTKIHDGDVIMTFAFSRVVCKILRSAQESGKKFRVIVVDSRPFLEGRKFLKELSEAGVDCTYLHMNAIGHVMKEVTKVFVGAQALFSNGALMSRVGTAAVCLLARRNNIPVIVCCETFKFSDRLQLDSFVYNEIGDPDALIPRDPLKATPTCQWRDNSSLKLLNVLYDVTPPEFISLVISEVGLIPVTSIPVVLREYNAASSSASPSTAF